MADGLDPSTRAALERLLAMAQGGTAQSSRCADFLLAWWNPEENGGHHGTGVLLTQSLPGLSFTIFKDELMMRTKLTLVATSLATLMMMTTAHAANPTTDLSISAKVVPSACNMDIANNGTFDHGDIAPATLSSSSTTELPEKILSYAISCNAPTTVSLSFVDNRAGTAIDQTSSYHFGLGQASGINIGYNRYLFTNPQTIVNGSPGSMLFTNDNGTVWVGQLSPWAKPFPNSALSYSEVMVANGVRGTPVAITTVTGQILAEVYVAATSTLDLTKEINLDGFATVQLNYI